MTPEKLFRPDPVAWCVAHARGAHALLVGTVPPELPGAIASEGGDVVVLAGAAAQRAIQAASAAHSGNVRSRVTVRRRPRLTLPFEDRAFDAVVLGPDRAVDSLTNEAGRLLDHAGRLVLLPGTGPSAEKPAALLELIDGWPDVFDVEVVDLLDDQVALVARNRPAGAEPVLPRDRTATALVLLAGRLSEMKWLVTGLEAGVSARDELAAELIRQSTRADAASRTISGADLDRLDRDLALHMEAVAATSAERAAVAAMLSDLERTLDDLLAPTR
jgi:SAM-dependent methyltransferase